MVLNCEFKLMLTEAVMDRMFLEFHRFRLGTKSPFIFSDEILSLPSNGFTLLLACITSWLDYSNHVSPGHPFPALFTVSIRIACAYERRPELELYNKTELYFSVAQSLAVMTALDHGGPVPSIFLLCSAAYCPTLQFSLWRKGPGCRGSPSSIIQQLHFSSHISLPRM